MKQNVQSGGMKTYQRLKLKLLVLRRCEHLLRMVDILELIWILADLEVDTFNNIGIEME